MIFVPTNVLKRRVGAGILRVSSRLYDGSGSIKMVLTKDRASKVLHRNLSELILLASQGNAKSPTQNHNNNNNSNQFQLQPTSVVTIRIPDSIDVIEAVTENISSSYRSNGKLIVTDGRNLVYFPPDLEEKQEEEEGKFSRIRQETIKDF